ncbi:MAG: RluA family pseudouridine synthase [Candidatus Firestonebacteria bacterium]
MEIKVFNVKNNINERIDVYVSKELNISRSLIQRYIKEGNISVNSKIVKSAYKIKTSDKIEVEIPKPRKINVLPEKISIGILYEDNDIIVVNKSAGMIVHPSGTCGYSGTLVNALLYHCKNLSGIGGFLRPGIVHRLDKDTSGILVVAKTDKAHQNLSKQFEERKVLKKYLVLVHGTFKEGAGEIKVPLGRSIRNRKKIGISSKKKREAITYFKVLERFKNATLLEVTPKTGRTHQIRVHLLFLGHPVIGDSLYGRKDKIINRQALHCCLLGFTHPRTRKYVEFISAVPQDIKLAIEGLKK